MNTCQCQCLTSNSGVGLRSMAWDNKMLGSMGHVYGCRLVSVPVDVCDGGHLQHIFMMMSIILHSWREGQNIITWYTDNTQTRTVK